MVEEGKIVVEADEDLEELIPGYLQNIRSDVKTMRDALAIEDFETVRSIGHSTKGSGGGYGFDAITDMGASLEIAGKESSAEVAEKSLNELDHFLDVVEVVYVTFE